MYNLIVTSSDEWEGEHGTADLSRVLEYTSDSVRKLYERAGTPDLDALSKLPTVFACETRYDGSQPPARVGTITRATKAGREVQIELAFDAEIAPIPNSVLTALSRELHIDMKASIHEFSRNHWSTKDVDLFKVLLRRGVGGAPKPSCSSCTRSHPTPIWWR